ncbi:MAG: hypothetical protein ABR572_09630 [Cryomorphaceae bacterium]
MRTFACITLFLVLSVFGFGQTAKDQQTIAQMSIDLEALQKYLRAHQTEEHNALYICDNGAIPTNLNLNKFGAPVKFLDKNALFFHVIEAYLYFEKFQVSEKEAQVAFQFAVEELKIELTFEKVGGVWKVVTGDME